jgi:hypothetical protein
MEEVNLRDYEELDIQQIEKKLIRALAVLTTWKAAIWKNVEQKEA